MNIRKQWVNELRAEITHHGTPQSAEELVRVVPGRKMMVTVTRLWISAPRQRLQTTPTVPSRRVFSFPLHNKATVCKLEWKAMVWSLLGG
jgi:hypothetical protein